MTSAQPGALAPTDDGSIWLDARIGWKEQSSWLARLSAWLKPQLRRGALQRLRRSPDEDLYLDDPEWLDRLGSEMRRDVELVAEDLADDLLSARLSVFHASRVVDAGVVHREGLRINDPRFLADEARRIVAEEEDLAWMRPTLEARIAGFEHTDRDTGTLYVVADDRPFLKSSGHYLIYGSEWIQVLLGWGAHAALRRRGSPTIFEVEMPLHVVHSSSRTEFARDLLREWSRQQAASDAQSPELDFSFMLRRDLPPEWVVRHAHPARIRDPFHPGWHHNASLGCPHCRNAS